MTTTSLQHAGSPQLVRDLRVACNILDLNPTSMVDPMSCILTHERIALSRPFSDLIPLVCGLCLCRVQSHIRSAVKRS